MRPLPKIRKTVKWGGLVACAGLLGLWKWTASTHATSYRGLSASSVRLVAVGDGRIEAGLVRVPRTSESPFNTLMQMNVLEPPGFKWWFRWCNDRTYTGLAVPMWAPVVIALVPTVLAWRLDTLARRRAKLGACPKCSYSRTGLAPDAVCPECGTAP